MSEVAQTRGRGIGGKVRSVCPTQIEIPGKAVPACVPDLAVVVAGTFRVPVVQHRVERHLERYVDLSRVPRADADGGAKPASGTFTSYHDLIVPHAQRARIFLQIAQRGVTIVRRSRIGGAESQPITRRHHHRAVVFDQIDCPRHMHHLLHPGDVTAAVNPEDACRLLCAVLWRENQCGDAAAFGGNADAPHGKIGIGLHGTHKELL